MISTRYFFYLIFLNLPQPPFLPSIHPTNSHIIQHMIRPPPSGWKRFILLDNFDKLCLFRWQIEFQLIDSNQAKLNIYL